MRVQHHQTNSGYSFIPAASANCAGRYNILLPWRLAIFPNL